MRKVAGVDAVPLAVGLWAAGLVAVAWAGRLAHPYDLEWMEGGMLVHAWRLLHGEPLYVDADAGWIPYIYPPGYPAVVAALGSVFGLGLPLGRAVSLAGTLAACAALGFGAWRQGSAAAGMLGALLFVACWPDTGAFYDLVRPDGLAIGLASWAIVLGLEPGRRARFGAAALLAAAFLVKHNLALLGAPMALGIWAMRGWREGLAFGLAAAVPALGAVVALELGSAEAPPWWVLSGPALALAAGLGAGWRGGAAHGALAGAVVALPALGGAAAALADHGHYLRTILGVPGAHPMVAGRLAPGAVEELGSHLGVALAASSIALVAGTARLAGPRRGVVAGLAAVGAGIALLGLGLPEAQGVPPASPWAEAAGWTALGAASGAALAGLGAAVAGGRLDGRWVYGLGVAFAAALSAGLMRAHHGGFLNVFIPFHWVVAFAFASAIAQSRRVWDRGPVWAAGAAAMTAQLWLKTGLEPERYVPGPEDREAGDRFVEALRRCDGPVLSPFAPWLAAQAGHEPSFHLIALWDVNHADSPYRAAVDRVTRAADSRRWACVVEGSGRPLGYGIQRNYVVREVPPVAAAADRPGPPPFMPRTGWRVRPKSILVPRPGPVSPPSR